MNYELEGKTIVITGGAAGIGFETARYCGEEGAQIAIIDLSLSDAEAAAQKLKDAGMIAAGFEADVINENAITDAMNNISERFGSIYGLANNAGIAGFGSVHEETLASWERIMAVNVTGTFLASKAALPKMIENGAGSIVNYGSVAGLVGIPTMAAYCAAKGAVVNLTRQMAAEYSSKNIRVNVVCPGTVATTDMGKLLLGTDMSDEMQAKRLAKYPMGRFGEPEEIAKAVTYLMGEGASYVSGAAFAVDGGMTSI